MTQKHAFILSDDAGMCTVRDMRDKSRQTKTKSATLCTNMHDPKDFYEKYKSNGVEHDTKSIQFHVVCMHIFQTHTKSARPCRVPAQRPRPVRQVKTNKANLYV